MKALALVFVTAFLGGCSGEPERAATPPPTPLTELALPVTAPMQARERLLHDMDRQQQLARDRAGAFDEVVGRER